SRRYRAPYRGVPAMSPTGRRCRSGLLLQPALSPCSSRSPSLHPYRLGSILVNCDRRAKGRQCPPFSPKPEPNPYSGAHNESDGSFQTPRFWCRRFHALRQAPRISDSGELGVRGTEWKSCGAKAFQKEIFFLGPRQDVAGIQQKLGGNRRIVGEQLGAGPVGLVLAAE